MRRAAKGRRAWPAVLGLVVALLAIALPAMATAPAAASSYAETRLWAFEHQDPAGSRADRGLSEDSIRGYAESSWTLTSGCPLGAGGGARATEFLRPDGRLIGQAGRGRGVRVLQGGSAEAESLFGQLTRGGKVVEGSTFPGKLIELPGGGRIGFRPSSTSGPPTIDVFVEGLSIRKIKFLP